MPEWPDPPVFRPCGQPTIERVDVPFPSYCSPPSSFFNISAGAATRRPALTQSLAVSDCANVCTICTIDGIRKCGKKATGNARLDQTYSRCRKRLHLAQCSMEDAHAESGLIQCAAVHMQPTSTIYPAREEPCVLRTQARSVLRGSASSRISENQSQRSRSELGSRRSGDNRFGGHHRISERGLSGTLAAGAA